MPTSLQRDVPATFISIHDLFATNTAFRHPCRHWTTWRGQMADRQVQAGYDVTQVIASVTLPGVLHANVGQTQKV